MRPFRTIIAALLLLTLRAPAADAGEFTGPGKTSSFGYDWDYIDGSFGGMPIGGLIARGKRKSVLRVDTVLSVANDGAVLQALTSVFVNGKSPNPSYMGTACVQGARRCTLTATYWLDLDQHPEMVGQPLAIEVRPSIEASHAGQFYELQFAAQLLRK